LLKLKSSPRNNKEFTQKLWDLKIFQMAATNKDCWRMGIRPNINWGVKWQRWLANNHNYWTKRNRPCNL
jgi:hypothetical protein